MQRVTTASPSSRPTRSRNSPNNRRENSCCRTVVLSLSLEGSVRRGSTRDGRPAHDVQRHRGWRGGVGLSCGRGISVVASSRHPASATGTRGPKRLALFLRQRINVPARSRSQGMRGASPSLPRGDTVAADQGTWFYVPTGGFADFSSAARVRAQRRLQAEATQTRSDKFRVFANGLPQVRRRGGLFALDLFNLFRARSVGSVAASVEAASVRSSRMAEADVACWSLRAPACDSLSSPVALRRRGLALRRRGLALRRRRASRKAM